jgi:translation initiation factor eIF-2B subunit epsilon
MPPKQKKANNDNSEEGEEPFQAVILTDSFEDQFLPISHEMPRVSSLPCLRNKTSITNTPAVSYAAL